MTIAGLHVQPVVLEMPEPHRTASGTVSHSPLVLTELRTNEGVRGYSVIFTYTQTALEPTASLLRNLEPLVIGQALTPLELERMLSAKFRLLGVEGLLAMALAAIDMAAWDALARSQNLSLVRLLGGALRPLRAYGAVGFDGEKGSAATATNWAKRGFTGVKAKIGYPTIDEDLRVIRAIRKAVGPEIALMVDYNQSLLPSEAIERLRRLEDENLTWIEEPVLAHDYQGSAVVAHAIRTPIQSGENWWGVTGVQNAIRAGASDFLMLDVMKVGGVTGWLRAASLAAAQGLRISSHLWPEISAQLLCVTPTAHWLEYADWWNAVLEHPLQIERGFAVPAGSAGSGVSWTEAALNRLGT